MTSITQKLSKLVGAAFEAQELPADLGRVQVSDRPDLAQFQCNGAMAAARLAKKNPREVAQQVIDYLNGHPEAQPFEKIEIAGPGFINIDVKDTFLSTILSENSQKDRLGVETVRKETVILDYGGPNIAKPMHVGHLRSSIIGDSLRRICLFAGYRALGDVHMGDWGTQMGQILSELERRGDLGRSLTLEDLEEIYPAASKACKEDEKRMEAARVATLRLQEGDQDYRKAWQQFVNVSIENMKKNFEALDVHFDLWKGEASVHDLIGPMVEDLKEKGLARESEGALIINISEESDKKEVPPLILYKRDGAVMYGTTDLATLADRMREYNPAKIIYIVDQRQSLHFEQVFRAARKGGIVPEEVELTHAGFGTMNGPDGKPFKTRAGGVMKLEDLIEMGIGKASQRLEEAKLAADFSPEEQADIAHKVAIAALKFADLQNQRQSDYVFDLDRMTSFEGKTGPYLLYQAVRIKSLLRKADERNLEITGSCNILIEAEDRPLALVLSEFSDHFEGALKNYTPHILAEYVYRLAQAFSSFYGQCHILSERDEALRASRLRLCQITYDTIETCLELLGIKIPARM